MNDKTIGRRVALKRALTVLGAAAVAPTLLSACGGGEESLSCTDTSGLTPAQTSVRETQHYVDAAPNAAEKCSGCTFFTAGQAGACGGCTVVQGPIHPDGTCDLWVAQT